MSVNFNLNNQNKQIYLQNRDNTKVQNQSFKGLGDFVTNTLVTCDANPVIGVSIIDLGSMIFPRTVVDATRNGFAATETFLRESAGLIINCLIPSFIVLGMAKLLEKPIMKDFSKYSPFQFWANQNCNETLTSAWLDTKNISDKTKRVNAYVAKVLDNIAGLEGKGNWKQIAQLEGKEQIYKDITEAILDTNKKTSNDKLKAAVDKLIEKFGVSKNIKLIDNHNITPMNGVKSLDIDVNLKNLTTEMKNLGSSFVKMSDAEIHQFSKRLTTLIKSKSAAGLAIIVALGASFQYFNRMLTKYRTGSQEFVGEADYLEQVKQGKKQTEPKEVIKQKQDKLNFHKLLGVVGMGLLAVLSFNKKPSLKMFQFNDIFPTMNQCRAISAVTYSGRIISSANDNELKETALRDTCTFVNLYYLGDYVSKAFAALSKHKDKLLNETVKLDSNANALQKFLHWFKNTELKAFDEIAKSDVAVKRSRAFAQASGLLYSCIVLGLIVPLYNKHRTNKKAEQKALFKQMQTDFTNAAKLDAKNIFTHFISKRPQLS